MRINKNFFKKAIEEGFKVFLIVDNKFVGTISRWRLEDEEDIRLFLSVGKFNSDSKIEDITKCNQIIFDEEEKCLEVVG